MNLPITVPLAIAIHCVPLCPLAPRDRENKFRLQSTLRKEWSTSPSHQNLIRSRFTNGKTH